jgi:hypothetical protein
MLTSTGHPRLRPAQSTMRICCDNRGQAVVEFTLCFILLLVIAWIPADFGLMFYTGHLWAERRPRGRSNRCSRPDNVLHSSAPATCRVAAGAICSSEVAKRVANGIMSGVKYHITLSIPSGTVPTCDQLVRSR